MLGRVMMRPVAMLERLTEVDLVLDSYRARLAEIAAALKEPADLAAARTALAETEAELARWRSIQQERDLAQQGTADKLARAEKRLYSGEIRNSREVQDAERDVQQLRHQRAEAEDALLEALVAIEGLAEDCAARTTKVAELAAGWEGTQARLRAEQTRLKERLLAEQARQGAMRRALPQDLLALYDNLRPRRGGRVVAALEGDTCSACRVAVPPTKLEAARYGEELVYCGNCGRLLWGE
jgi:predicted  nucleic acid-binding Zn-ribbon protein